MLATKSQIDYLNDLAQKTEFIRSLHPSIIPQGYTFRRWDMDMTSDKASARIDYHKAILRKAYAILFPWNKVDENEDLPA